MAHKRFIATEQLQESVSIPLGAVDPSSATGRLLAAQKAGRPIVYFDVETTGLGIDPEATKKLGARHQVFAGGDVKIWEISAAYGGLGTPSGAVRTFATSQYRKGEFEKGSLRFLRRRAKQTGSLIEGILLGVGATRPGEVRSVFATEAEALSSFVSSLKSIEAATGYKPILSGYNVGEIFPQWGPIEGKTQAEMLYATSEEAKSASIAAGAGGERLPKFRGFDIPLAIARAKQLGLEKEAEYLQSLEVIDIHDITREHLDILYGRGIVGQKGPRVYEGVKRSYRPGIWKPRGGVVGGYVKGTKLRQTAVAFLGESGWSEAEAHAAAYDIIKTRELAERIVAQAESGAVEFAERAYISSLQSTTAQVSRVTEQIAKAAAAEAAVKEASFFARALAEYRKLPFAGKAAAWTIGAGTTGLILGGVWSLFSGFDDDYNTIQGLRHGGIAAELRRLNTDFGSGVLLSYFSKSMRESRGLLAKGFNADLRAALKGLNAEIITSNEALETMLQHSYSAYIPRRLDKVAQIRASLAAARKPGSFSYRLMREVASSEELAAMGITPVSMHRFSIIHELAEVKAGRFRSRQIDRRYEVSERFAEALIAKDEAEMANLDRKLAGIDRVIKSRLSNDFARFSSHGSITVLAEEAIAARLQSPAFFDWVRTVRTKEAARELPTYWQQRLGKMYARIEENWSRLAAKFRSNIAINKIPGFDDAYNTIEGLSHRGVSGAKRPIDTDFGSGWQGLWRAIRRIFGRRSKITATGLWDPAAQASREILSVTKKLAERSEQLAAHSLPVQQTPVRPTLSPIARRYRRLLEAERIFDRISDAVVTTRERTIIGGADLENAFVHQTPKRNVHSILASGRLLPGESNVFHKGKGKGVYFTPPEAETYMSRDTNYVPFIIEKGEGKKVLQKLENSGYYGTINRAVRFESYEELRTPIKILETRTSAQFGLEHAYRLRPSHEWITGHGSVINYGSSLLAQDIREALRTGALELSSEGKFVWTGKKPWLAFDDLFGAILESNKPIIEVLQPSIKKTWKWKKGTEVAYRIKDISTPKWRGPIPTKAVITDDEMVFAFSAKNSGLKWPRKKTIAHLQRAAATLRERGYRLFIKGGTAREELIRALNPKMQGKFTDVDLFILGPRPSDPLQLLRDMDIYEDVAFGESMLSFFRGADMAANQALLEVPANEGAPFRLHATKEAAEDIISGRLRYLDVESERAGFRIDKFKRRYRKAKVVKAPQLLKDPEAFSQILTLERGQDSTWRLASNTAANTIEGLRHGNFAGALRPINTDFGSGWLGLHASVHGVMINPDIVSFRRHILDNPIRRAIFEQQVKAAQASNRPESFEDSQTSQLTVERLHTFPGLNRDFRGDIRLVDLKSGEYKFKFDDADTLLLKKTGLMNTLFGKEISIRLAGIDAPEVGGHSDDPMARWRWREEQPGGQEAGRVFQEMVEKSNQLYLVMDPGQKTYGRYIGVLFNERGNINQAMLRSGYVSYLPYGESGTSLINRKQFDKAEREAIDAEQGMWSTPYWKTYLIARKKIGGSITFNTFTLKNRLAENFSLAALEESMAEAQETGRVGYERAIRAGEALRHSYGQFFNKRKKGSPRDDRSRDAQLIESELRRRKTKHFISEATKATNTQIWYLGQNGGQLHNRMIQGMAA